MWEAKIFNLGMLISQAEVINPREEAAVEEEVKFMIPEASG